MGDAKARYGGVDSPRGTRLVCRVCKLELDPIPAKQHFLVGLGKHHSRCRRAVDQGKNVFHQVAACQMCDHQQACRLPCLQGRRHYEACLEADECDFVCFNCGLWCNSEHNLQQHLNGCAHRNRGDWLDERDDEFSGESSAYSHEAEVRSRSPAPGASSYATCSQPSEAARETNGQAAQPAPQTATPAAVSQQTLNSLSTATLQCRICDWTGSGRAAWDHFQVGSFTTWSRCPTCPLEICAVLSLTRVRLVRAGCCTFERSGAAPPAPSRVPCVQCGIWCPNRPNLLNAHRPSARHQKPRAVAEWPATGSPRFL